MLNEHDTYLMLGGLAFAVSILFVILAISKSKKRSILTDEVTRKKQILNEKSVEDVVAELTINIVVTVESQPLLAVNISA